MEQPSIPERLAESGLAGIAVGSAAVALSAIDPTFGGAIGGICTLLMSSIGAISFQTRLNETVRHLADDLGTMRDQVSAMSSAQFKLASESLQTLLRTSEQEKLEYLRNVISEAVVRTDLDDTDASILSRIIRDISAAEIRLLIESSTFDVICAEPNGGVLQSSVILDTSYKDPYVSALRFNIIDAAQRMLLSGLIGLGLILRSNVIGEFYDFTPTARTLVRLLNGPAPT